MTGSETQGAGARMVARVSLLLVSLMLLMPLQAWAQSTLKFCYDPYPPYTMGQEGATEGGLKVSLLDAVMDRIDGVSAEVVLMPWKRCQAQAKAGEVDGILPLFRNAERETYLAFTSGTFRETSHFWYNRDSFPDGLDWSGDYSTLSHLRLGMLNGGFINEEMERTFSEVRKITRARDVQTLMRLLLKGRIDLIATDGAVGRYTAHQNGWQDQIFAIEHPISEKTSEFGLSKSSGADRHLDAFNQAIRALDEAGEIYQILQNTN